MQTTKKQFDEIRCILMDMCAEDSTETPRVYQNRVRTQVRMVLKLLDLLRASHPEIVE